MLVPLLPAADGTTISRWPAVGSRRVLSPRERGFTARRERGFTRRQRAIILISSQPLVAHCLGKNAGRARLLGPKRIELFRKVVGDGDRSLALREVGVVVGHVVGVLPQDR